jgi:membrane protein
VTARVRPGRREWRYVITRTAHSLVRNRVVDEAASLTFFATLTLFPGALAVISALGLAGGDNGAVRFIEGLIDEVGNGDAVDAARGPLEQLTGISNPGIALAIGLALTLWTGSAYATAFGRATNTLYGVQEGRRIWKFRALMVIVAAVLIVGAAAVILLLSGTPRVASAAAEVLNIGQPWLTVWLIGRWPVLFALVCALISVLYFWTPAIERQNVPLFSWGSVVALVGWGAATAGFLSYVTRIAHYDELYGWLGGALVVLLWLYLTNFVLLIGAAVDAETVRMRQLLDGMPAEQVIKVPMRDTSRNLVIARSLAADEAEGAAIRLRADAERKESAQHL